VRGPLLLCLVILGVPLAGFAASTALRAHNDAELVSLASRGKVHVAPSEIPGLTVARICQSPTMAGTGPCEVDSQLALMSNVSLGAGIAGLALVGLIVLAGQVARSNRALLLAVFRPGLYVAAVVTIALVIVHAILAMAIIYYGESALVERVHGGLILAIGLGAIAGVAGIAKSMFGAVQKAETGAVGVSVSTNEAEPLWNHTAGIARKLGALQPDHIVVGLEPTFFVTEANVRTPAEQLTGRTLFCSLPLARILTIDELTAIIGHELGHFRGEDTKFSGHFYPIYRGTTTAIASLQAAGGGSMRVLSLLPAVAILSFFLDRFAVAENLHSRSRELLADQAGAEATSARTMASALVKVHAFASLWGGFQQASVQQMTEGKVFKNASTVFAGAVASAARPEALDGIAATHSSHPTDSHPTLADRLDALGVELSSVTADALAIAPAPSAASLVPETEAREEALSMMYQQLLARQLGIQPKVEQSRGSNWSPVRQCLNCGTKVLPKGDGQCPRCGARMA